LLNSCIMYQVYLENIDYSSKQLKGSHGKI